MLKLKLQYFGHLVRRVDSLEKTLMLGGIGGGGEGDDRGWDGWMASPTRWTWVWVNSGSLWWTGRPGVLRFMGSQRVRHDWETELTIMLKWKREGHNVLSEETCFLSAVAIGAPRGSHWCLNPSPHRLPWMQWPVFGESKWREQKCG